MSLYCGPEQADCATQLHAREPSTRRIEECMFEEAGSVRYHQEDQMKEGVDAHD